MTRRTSASIRLSLAALAAAALLAAVPAVGQETSEDPTASDAFLRAKGRVTFRVYCANCHGPKGLGDGTLAEILKVPPADLTRLAAKNDGEFPREEIHRIIDGREWVKGHGSREMPIWGEAFIKTLQPTWQDVSDEERAQLKIVEVVYYLESIQGD